MNERRSRIRRTRTGKRLALTPRDIDIFRAVSRYRYLRSTYLHAFVGGASETRFKERLGDLFHEGYLDRPSQQWQFADALHAPVVYESGEGARRALCESGIAVDEPRTLLAQTAHRQFQHSLMICELLASLEIATRGVPGLGFIPWSEVLARAPEATRASPRPFQLSLPSGAYLVPDGLFGLEYVQDAKKSYRFFALEADRGTMPVERSDKGQTSYLAKLAGYQGIIAQRAYKTTWGTPNLLVLTVTTSESRLQEIMQRLAANGGGHAAFLFKSAMGSDLRRPMLRLLLQPWQRAVPQPMRIDSSQ